MSWSFALHGWLLHSLACCVDHLCSDGMVSKAQQQLTPAAGTCLHIVSDVFCLVAAYIFGFLLFIVSSLKAIIKLNEDTLVALSCLLVVDCVLLSCRRT